MRRLLLPLLLTLASWLPCAGQISRAETAAPIASPRVFTEEVDSKLMGRKMPYRIVVPARYSTKEESGRRFAVLYLLHGLTGHFDNWTRHTNLVDYSAGYDLIIVTPEGENGWYTDNLTKDGDKFESYIIRELIPQIDKRYRTIDRRDHRAIAGLSMGGFGAVKFGLKYPELFKLVGSFSGVIGAASITEREIPGAIGRTIDAIFGPAGTEVRKANDTFDTVRRATPEKIKIFPFIYLDCGTEDLFFQNNRDFVGLLIEKKVPHEFRQLPGGHNWTYWDTQVDEFLEVVAKRGIASFASSQVGRTDLADSVRSGSIRSPGRTDDVQLRTPPSSSGNQQRTDINDATAARLLLGRHRFSLQWVGWDHFGTANVTNERGVYSIKGEQRGRGPSKDFVKIDGAIISIDKNEFTFRGTIVTQVSHINGGKPCVREGEFTFKITGKRRYWRLQQMDNPCDPVTDYVDIYFR